MATPHNFKCPKTGKTFLIVGYSVSVKGGTTSYLDIKTKRVIKNPENGEALEYIEKEFEGFANVGVFGAQNREGRVKAMKKRSADDNDRQKKKRKTYFNGTKTD